MYDFGETLLVDCDYGYQPVPAERVTCLEADGFQNIHCKGKILGPRKKFIRFSFKAPIADVVDVNSQSQNKSK